MLLREHSGRSCAPFSPTSPTACLLYLATRLPRLPACLLPIFAEVPTPSNYVPYALVYACPSPPASPSGSFVRCSHLRASASAPGYCVICDAVLPAGRTVRARDCTVPPAVAVPPSPLSWASWSDTLSSCFTRSVVYATDKADPVC